MQVHTFIAESANEAVDRIRTELGPSAVVLSVRKLPRTGLERFLKQDQIEVLAGVEETLPAKPSQRPIRPVLPPPSPAESLAELREEVRQLRKQVFTRNPPAAEPRPAEQARPVERKTPGIAHILNQTGVLPSCTAQILQELPDIENLTVGEQIAGASEVLRARWRPSETDNSAAVHVFVGVPGSGKSTVLCKMLAQTSLVEGQPATVYQLDSHIANPSPQPGVYSEIVGAQFERTLPLQFERREESVFVDLPGVPLHNEQALARVRDLIAEFGVPEIHLVLNAAYESSHLLEQVRFFSSLGISDLIITHLDEETRWGKLWNLVFGTNFSLRAFCEGQNIPGDIQLASCDILLDRQFRGK
jgi:flagellar biosynthesis protein FlhF